MIRRLISKALRAWDRRNERYPVIMTGHEWMLMKSSQRYRTRMSHVSTD